MDVATSPPPKLPPAWFKHLFWRVHRGVCRLSGGRFLWTPSGKRGWGALELTAVGRRSGAPRRVILGYLEDGADVTVLAMNGWDEGLPAWWLNVQAHPDVTVRLPGAAPRPARARTAEGAERDRLWQRWLELEPDTERYAADRQAETPVVVFELPSSAS